MAKLTDVEVKFYAEKLRSRMERSGDPSETSLMISNVLNSLDLPKGTKLSGEEARAMVILAMDRGLDVPTVPLRDLPTGRQESFKAEMRSKCSDLISKIPGKKSPVADDVVTQAHTRYQNLLAMEAAELARMQEAYDPYMQLVNARNPKKK